MEKVRLEVENLVWTMEEVGRHRSQSRGALSHLNTRTPTGDDVIQRRDLKPAFSDDLYECVLQHDNIYAAWKRVRANKGAAGIDGITINEFPAWAKLGGWKR